MAGRIRRTTGSRSSAGRPGPGSPAQAVLPAHVPHEQPDLNWRSPAVREAQLAMVRGWLARGADGFRLDVFNTFFKDPSLASNPPRTPPPRGLASARLEPPAPRQRQGPARAGRLPGRVPGDRRRGSRPDDRRRAVRRPARVRREVRGPAPSHLRLRAAHPALAGGGAGKHDRRSRGRLRPDRWPAVVLSTTTNRATRRVTEGLDRDAVAKAAAVLLLTLRGTPFLYYGEEIALGDIKVPRRDIVDPPARRYWPLPLWWNRDGCRAPMPWSGGPNGGLHQRPTVAPDGTRLRDPQRGGAGRRRELGAGDLPAAARRAPNAAGAPDGCLQVGRSGA